MKQATANISNPSRAVSKESSDSTQYDLIVIGAGGAGMAASLFAAIDGLKVLLLEKTEFVGGTTALSAGTIWIPNTPHAATVGTQDSVALAAQYLDSVVGSHADPAMRAAFLEHGPTALAVLEQKTYVKVRPYARHPDYESDLAGARLCGRALEPLPYDGRLLGTQFALLRPPIPEFTVLGGMMVDRTDINHLLAMTRSWPSLRHAAGIIMRHACDRLRYPRGTRLVMGNALIGRLLQSLGERDVTIMTGVTLESLDRSTDLGAERIAGVTVTHRGQRRRFAARAGVILTSGGFNRHARLRSELLPSTPSYTPGAPGHTGEAIALALAEGAHMGTNNWQNAFWAPVSVRQRKDGSRAVFPHFVMDRAKPGTLVVNQAGQRFLNESTSYHRFGAAMHAAHQQSPSIPAFLIADSSALRKYGLGMVRPGARGLQAFIDDGYLVTATTLPDLAVKLGIDADALTATVKRFNTFAQNGSDPDFGRGMTEYQRNIGDPTVQPNPNLGPLSETPYYAVRLYPGDIGASAGLVADAQARVLDGAGKPIAGLFVAGNDMNSIMGGTYPGPGITIGPALTFAYIAATQAAREWQTRKRQQNRIA
jgi:succinate dehydrogenase/fumarate reductase flavoprotein subunit